MLPCSVRPSILLTTSLLSHLSTMLPYKRPRSMLSSSSTIKILTALLTLLCHSVRSGGVVHTFQSMNQRRSHSACRTWFKSTLAWCAYQDAIERALWKVSASHLYATKSAAMIHTLTSRPSSCHVRVLLAPDCRSSTRRETEVARPLQSKGS